MKKLSYLLLLFVFVITTACSEDDSFDEPDPVEETPEEVPEEPEEPTEPEVPEETPEEGDPQTYAFAPGETRGYIVDGSASEETVALFYHLKAISDSRFIIGQQDAFNAFYNSDSGESDMKKLTGSDPGMLGSDFMFITDDSNNGEAGNWFYQQEQQITQDAIEAYDKGMVNAFTWHLREPYEGDDFYTSEMTAFQRENAFRSIMPGGANHDYYREKLQKVAEVVKNLRGSDGTLIPVIFRPFHEFDGDFFWWGAPYSTPAEFKEVWRFTVTYLRDELDVHNILYAFAPDNSYTSKSAYLSRYPGDEYVDILGMDNYGDFSSQSGSGVAAANQKLKVVSDLAKERNKVAALTETGYFVDAQNPLPSNFYSENIYNVITESDVNIGFIMFWQNYADSYTVPVPGVEGEDDFMEFIEKEEALLLEDLPSLYDMPAN
ncbi:glycosyl hydrolase [Zunongwangia sp. F260]|uniref:Glycosyl hydrolase n=1 Tax=Autumnicola lenta TaxID=3075593 RepID=A0ABU3CFG3_9FLAO|nr:glycosyl hydrolase [Zunongwangia sp. F260]MDT0645092.1 glycosyl hydrolase [Zunongwangia sp. F260]